MENYIEKIVDVLTGEETFEDYTPEMIAEAKQGEIVANEITAKMAELQNKRSIAISKLEELGLTTDDLKALGL